MGIKNEDRLGYAVLAAGGMLGSTYAEEISTIPGQLLCQP